MNVQGHICHRSFEDIEIVDNVDCFIDLRQCHYRVKIGQALKVAFQNSAYLSSCLENFKYAFLAKSSNVKMHFKNSCNFLQHFLTFYVYS